MLFLPLKDVPRKQCPVCCGTLKRMKKVQWEGTILSNSTGPSKDRGVLQVYFTEWTEDKVHIFFAHVVDILETENGDIQSLT